MILLQASKQKATVNAVAFLIAFVDRLLRLVEDRIEPHHQFSTAAG